MKKNKSFNKKAGLCLIITGFAIILTAVGIYAFWSYEDISAQNSAQDVLVKVKENIEGNNSNLVNKGEEKEKKPLIGGYEYAGYLSIPTINLELPVMTEWDYKRLKIAPCIYYGSPEENNLVIAAHNYKSQFAKLSSLSKGDTVIFTDLTGNPCKYRVCDVEILKPTNVEEMIGSGWHLTLYTCTRDAKSRLTIRCLKED